MGAVRFLQEKIKLRPVLPRRLAAAEAHRSYSVPEMVSIEKIPEQPNKMKLDETLLLFVKEADTPLMLQAAEHFV